jgi:hypothetical protein
MSAFITGSNNSGPAFSQAPLKAAAAQGYRALCREVFYPKLRIAGLPRLLDKPVIN